MAHLVYSGLEGADAANDEATQEIIAGHRVGQHVQDVVHALDLFGVGESFPEVEFARRTNDKLRQVDEVRIRGSRSIARALPVLHIEEAALPLPAGL